MDVDSIAPGEDFVSILEARVAECDVLLALIGRGWLTATDEVGRRRLDNAKDFVRIEIATALTQAKRVIPVLIDDVPMPRSEDLPEALKQLVRCQATRLSHDRFRADSDGLIRALKQVLDAKAPSPASDSTSWSQEGPLTPTPTSTGAETEKLPQSEPEKADKPKPSVSDWLRRAASWLQRTAPVAGARILPIIQGIANRSRAWVGGFTKRKMAIAASVGVLAVLVAVIFNREGPTPPIPQDTNIPEIAAQITKCNRAKGVLTIYIEFVNNKEEAYEIRLVEGGKYNQYSVVASGKRYFILLDDDKVPMATPLNYSCYPKCTDLRVKIGGGGSYTFWAMYPAPPADVNSIIFYTPFSRPFVDVPITDYR